MSLRPPSTSPSPSPGPHENGRASARQSMGPSSRGTPTLAPLSPRPGGQSSARPTSELLGTGAMAFQTPEAEALDQWFENLQNYEATLEEMAAASLDVNFKEELSAIEQWFKVLSEAERTAALYSLLQHSTQVQIRFFITVLQQMARSDPMTALLSPAMGSMQSQMESRLGSIKSPGIKSGLPASPTARNFSTNRQSLALDNSSNYLSPDSAANPSGQDGSAAATLAQQRAKLKANRISAPILSPGGGGGADSRTSWGPSTHLSQVTESQSISDSDARPKSTEFSGTLSTPKLGGSDGPDSWASMVNTPLVPMFKKEPARPAPASTSTLNEPPKNDWHAGPAPGVPRMGDPTIHRRNPKAQNNQGPGYNHQQGNDHHGGVYDDNGNPIPQGRPGGPRGAPGNNNWGPSRGPGVNGPGGGGAGPDASMPNMNMNGLGMQGFPMPGLGSPTLGMGMPGLGMQPMSPFNMNMLGMMSPEAQLLAAQMAAAGAYQPHMFGMQPLSAGLGPGGMHGRGRGPPGSARSPGPKSATSNASSRHDGNSTPKGEEEVNPELLTDISGWLRSLRLHKYTPNFEGCRWQDMVMMDEAALEAKGVAALGARRKMLKTFELVRKKMGIEGGPPPSAGLNTPTTATSNGGGSGPGPTGT